MLESDQFEPKLTSSGSAAHEANQNIDVKASVLLSVYLNTQPPNLHNRESQGAASQKSYLF